MAQPARMTPDQIAVMFPHASKSLLELNVPAPGDLNREVIAAAGAAPKLKLARQPNQTEREMALILKAKYPDATIRYEAIKLRLGDKCGYTPDFLVTRIDHPILFVEAKGGHIWDDSKVKFRTAQEQYPEFDFEMWQKKSDQWLQLA